MSADLSKPAPPIATLVQLMRSHVRLSALLLIAAVLLLGCTWIYAWRRLGFENLGRVEHVKLVVRSSRLNFHDLDIEKPHEYYVGHPEVEEGRKELAER